jgi:hypothetical protein
MRDGQKSSRGEERTSASAARLGSRADDRDPLSDAQSTLGNRDFGRVMGPAGAFVVEDDAKTIAPGQMRRTAFLAAVRAAVCGTANEGFAGTGRTADDCPWIEHWLSVYEQRDAEHLNGALRKFAPETTRAATSTEAIAMIAARVRRSVDRYVGTGEITGIPEGFSPALPGLGLLGGVLGGLLFKARPGGPARTPDPGTVRAQLGAGQPMPGGVRSRMERVFGASFSHVRLHRDGEAAALSSRLNARAFTVGEHVAFGGGEYQPGTLVGDALLAHELAHVVQQGSTPSSKAEPDGLAHRTLEKDADAAAVRAVVALGGKARAAAPRLRSGLRLQRCGREEAKTPAAARNLQTDKALRKSWDAAFQEGLALLNASLAKKGKERGCRFPGAKNAAEWEYDKTSWRQVTGGEALRKYGVAYEPLKAPHLAVDELFAHLERWECDCALFTELTWLYAWRHTLSNSEFDAKFARLRLRPQESTGLERETHVRENIELGLETGDFDQMWADAPVGTKVSWTNESVHARSPWRFENAVKSRKGRTPGDDRYDAHPIGANLTEEQVKRGLAENSEDFPGRPFVITDDALSALAAEGAPPELIRNLEPLKGQTFIGKSEFSKALAGPVQPLASLRAQDPSRYHVIMAKLFETAHLVATEQDKRQYIERYIRRHEFQIPK